jgi:hypothetical protein
MPRQKNSRWTFLILALSLLAVSLACSAAETLINGTPTPPPSPTVTLIPRETSTPTVTPLPTLDWTPVACAGDDCLNACMSRVDAIMQTSPFKTLANEYYKGATNFDLVSYPVNGNQLGAPDKLWAPADYHVYQDDLAAHQRIWNFFTAVIPPETRNMVDKLMIYTDGPGNYLAWVRPSTDRGKTWTIGFDILDSEVPLYLTETLVHEVGHLVTLNADQVPVTNTYNNGEQNLAVCKQYLMYEGCSTKDSYINQFYQRFWLDIYKEWQQIDKAQNTDEYYTMLDNFYQRHPYEFVSLYAVTNPKEDIAESWKDFVLRPKPTGNDIADQKILFFYDFPELVKVRQEIIAGLCSYTR